MNPSGLWGIALCVTSLLPSIAQGGVIVGTDRGNPRELGVILAETSSKDSKVFSYQYRPNDPNGALLGRMTGSAYIVGSGPERGQALRFFHQAKTGLVTRMVSGDRSRVDLVWDRKSGYRRAVIVMRDSTGKKLNSLSRTSIRAKSINPSEMLLSDDVPTYVSMERVSGVTREQVESGSWNNTVIREIYGLFNVFGQKVINNIIDKVSRVPTFLSAPGKFSGKILDVILDYTKGAFDDAVWDAVGDVTSSVRDRFGNKLSLPDASMRDTESARLNGQYVASAPITPSGLTSYAPLAPTRGRPNFEPSSISLKPGESAKVKVIREYGDTGVMAGIVSLASEYSSASVPEDLEVLRPAYVFLDGQSGPHEITVRAKPQAGNTSQKTFYLRPSTSFVSGENLLAGTLLPQVKLEKGKSFEVINYSGSIGETLLSHPGCDGSSWSLRLDPRILLVLSYSGSGNRGAARVRVYADVYRNGRYEGYYHTYDWRGWVQWDGASFKGTIPSISGGSLNAEVEFRWNGSRYVGSYTVPITARQTSPCTSPRYLQEYSNSGLIMVTP